MNDQPPSAHEIPFESVHRINSKALPHESDSNIQATDHNIPIQHQARYHQNFPKAGYLLPSDEQEKDRLLLQHELLKRAWESKLILAPTSIPCYANILDCGTGSGSWLLNLSHEVDATIHLYGTDIEARLFPSDPPSNTNFSVGSILEMPSHWTHMFDLVHQRLLVAALRRSEWPVAFSEIFRVLKPGGWVQLGEIGRMRRPGPITLRHETILDTVFNNRGLTLNCATYLPDLLMDAGFTDIRMETRLLSLGKWAGKEGMDARDNFMGVFRGMKTPVLKAGGMGFFTSEDDFDRFMDEMESEWDQCTSAREFTVFLARKPQN